MLRAGGHDPVSDVRVCPGCGTPSSEADGSCPICGAALRPPPQDSAEVRKIVTILFTDMTGSTVIGEQLDPESLRRVMSLYFTELKRVLQRHAATIEKYIGDAVMAVFGLPVAHEDDALRAVRAAVEMRAALDHINAELKNSLGVTLQTRTGLNTGEVLGSSVPGNPALVVGDAVNVAARLEQAAEPGEILIADATFRLVRDAVVTEAVGPLSLKGKTNPVRAWRVLELHPSISGWNRRMDSPLVTREGELRQLHGILERVVRTSACHAVTVMGGAGVGKSRLVSEFLSQIADGAHVAQGRCLPYGEGITFRPIVEVLQQLAGISVSDNSPTALSKLGLLLATAPDAAIVTERTKGLLVLGDTPTSIQETFWALRRLVQQVAATKPVVLVFDDVQWAETTLLDLLEYLLEWLVDSRVLIVCLARPELADVRPGWLEGRTNATLLKLQPLQVAGVARLIHNLVAGAELASEAESRIEELAEGNPLFVEETLRMLVDDDLLRLVEDRWTVVGDLSRAAIPPTIHALITARLDRLEPEERRVVERASVMGRQFWWGALVEITPPDQRASVARSLQSLSRKELIHPGHSDLVGEDAFEFQHILIRDTAYAEMPKEIRADLHERLAEWIGRRTDRPSAERDEMMAFHLEQSYRARHELGLVTVRVKQQGRRAATLLTSVGKHAFTRGDMPAAVTLMSRAEALLSSDDLQRLELLPTLAAALMEVGEFERLLAVTVQARDLAGVSGDPRGLAHASILDLYVRLFTNPESWAEEAEREAHHALATFERLADDGGLARGWSLFGLVHMMKGQFARAQHSWEKTAEHAAAAGDHRTEVDALCWLLISMWAGPATREQGLERALQVLERASTDHKLRATTMLMRAAYEGGRGEASEATQWIEQARSLLQEIALTVWIAGPLAQMAGSIELDAGVPHAAEQELRWAYETLVGAGEVSWASTAAALLAQAVDEQGRSDEARDLVERSREMAGVEDIVSQLLWRRVAAPERARRGQVHDAETLIREALDLAAATDSLVLQGQAQLGLADVLALSGDPSGSAEAVAAAVQVFERKGDVHTARRIAEDLAERSL
ncbi:ATP-binding protein [Geodermatophilus sp. SYSU D01180]